MDRQLLELLACPQCHAELTLHADVVEGKRVHSGRLECPDRHEYPIHDSVPVFAGGHDYMTLFTSLRRGAEGTLPNVGELDVDAITRKEFAAQTGVDPATLRGRHVLDAGCGDGRFAALLASHGASVVGIDLDAAGLARVSKRAIGNIHVVQGDLFHLPFRASSFDFIYSLGVLHHTPEPPRAFNSLRRLLKPRGQIAVWVYPKGERTPISDFIRPLTTRLPYGALYWLAVLVTALYSPLLRIPRIKQRVQSMLYSTRLPWHEQKSWRVHSFLDWYGPRYQFKYTPAELERWCVDAGLTDVVHCSDPSSVRATAPQCGVRHVNS